MSAPAQSIAANPVDRVHQIAVKLYIDAPDALVPRDFVDAFHDWIRDNTLPELAIDVTDYSHVQNGPGVMLIGHEGHYSVDDIDGRLGLTYWFRRDTPGPLVGKLRQGLERVVNAARLLETHPRLTERLRFHGNDVRVILASRLLAPNSASTFEATGPVIEEVVGSLFAGSPVTLTQEPDPARLFAVQATTGVAIEVAQLQSRLAPN